MVVSVPHIVNGCAHVEFDNIIISLVYTMLPVSLDCPFVIVPSVFSFIDLPVP
jgi:hypothetical protein